MGFDRRYTLGLIVWLLLLVAAVVAAAAALREPELGVAKLVAVAFVAAAFAGLWRHITRTNRNLARFLEALRFGDTAVQFDGTGGSGYSELGRSLNQAMARFRAEQARLAGELRYFEALIDDMPVAVLTVDAEAQVTLANKAARRLFDGHAGRRPEDFAGYAATLARRLADGGAGEEILILNLRGRSQRVLVSAANLVRLGHRSRALSIQPIQGALDAVEMAAQTELVRVLTHEVLNSLTPVTSLAATAAHLLADPDLGGDARIADARTALATLSRRAQGLGNFIGAYRAVAQPPEIRRQVFAARPWADEIARLFAAEAPRVGATLQIEPPGLALDADPDLLAQVLINLLHNAAQALEAHPDPRLTLRFHQAAASTVIEVQDNGPGVPAALRGDVFLPFFTTRASGTGVGLNLARQIVVAHSGSIDVLDAPGGGALFRIVL